MNAFNQWNYIRTRVVTDKGDDILCIGIQPPAELIGNIEITANTDNLSNRQYDLILAESQLINLYQFKDHFNKIKCHLKETGVYALTESVVGEEDAWINTLLSFINPSHIRAPRVEEVISAAAELLELTEFLRFGQLKHYPLPKNKISENISSQLESFPEYIMDKLSPRISGGELILTQQAGLFIWQNEKLA